MSNTRACGQQANVNASFTSSKRCPERRLCSQDECNKKKTGRIFSVENKCCCARTSSRRGSDVFAVVVDSSASGPTSIRWFNETVTVDGQIIADEPQTLDGEEYFVQDTIAVEYPGYTAANGDIFLSINDDEPIQFKHENNVWVNAKFAV